MAMAKLKNVGITGSSGFIGSHLTRYLAQKNIPFACFSGNALRVRDVERFFLDNKISQVVFLIGTFDLPFENQLKINVLTLQKFLEVGMQYGLKKIIFTSSGAVYGEPKKGESSENDPLEPNTLYGLSKLLAEDCILYYARNNSLRFVILRFPNVYGENNKGVISKFLSDIKKYKKITIAGNGTQKRNFLHVKDACIAIGKALQYRKSDIFNISNPTKILINELAEKLKGKYNFSIQYKPKDNSPDNILLNIEKAKKLLCFKPKVADLEI